MVYFAIFIGFILWILLGFGAVRWIDKLNPHSRMPFVLFSFTLLIGIVGWAIIGFACLLDRIGEKYDT